MVCTGWPRELSSGWSFVVEWSEEQYIYCVAATGAQLHPDTFYTRRPLTPTHTCVTAGTSCMVAPLFHDPRSEQPAIQKAHNGMSNIDERIIKSIGTCRPRDGATDRFHLWRDQLSRVLNELGIDTREPMPQPPTSDPSKTSTYMTPETTAQQLRLESAYGVASN